MLHKFFYISIFLIFASAFSQQNATISGNVTDFEIGNEPILFASVKIKESAASVQTNFHGNYRFENIASGEYILVFSFLGYDDKEIAVSVKEDKNYNVNVALTSKTIAIDLLSDTEIAGNETISKNSVNKISSID